MDVGLDGDRIGAVAAATDEGALLHGRSACDQRLGELEQRDRVAVGGLDRERPSALRERAHEGDGSGRGREHVGSDGRAEVDAAVLPACVRIGTERERPQHRPGDGPGPAEGRRGERERRERDRGNEHLSHERLPPFAKRTTCAPR